MIFVQHRQRAPDFVRYEDVGFSMLLNCLHLALTSQIEFITVTTTTSITYYLIDNTVYYAGTGASNFAYQGLAALIASFTALMFLTPSFESQSSRAFTPCLA